MGLETGNFIADLEPVYPLAADGKDQGDDHIRLIKTVLQNSIAGFPGAVLVGGTDTGVSNTYVLSPVDPLRAYSVNLTILWLPATTNGGASTINISGLGPQPIRRNDGTVVENGDIMAGNPIVMLYNGSEFRLVAVTKRYVDNLISSGALPGQPGNAGKPLITDGTNASFSNAFGVAMDEAEGAPIAASSTLNLASGAGTGNFTHITGSGFTINAITLPAGAARTLVFDGNGALANSANLILPTGANITVAPDDVAIVRGEGAGVTRVVSFTRKSGRALVEPTPAGLVLLATIVPASGVTAIDALNVFSATYDDYLIIADDLSSASNVSGNDATIALFLAKSAVVDSTAAYIAAAVGATTNSALATAFATGMKVKARLTATGASSELASFAELRISNVNDTAATAFHGVEVRATANAYDLNAGGAFTGRGDASMVIGAHCNAGAAGAVSGFRLSMTNGTFGATGSLKIYGVRKV